MRTKVGIEITDDERLNLDTSPGKHSTGTALVDDGFIGVYKASVQLDEAMQSLLHIIHGECLQNYRKGNK